MEIQIAVAKINKYASSESGDTIEIVERPNGGISVVIADGQSSGRGAKASSTLVVRKVLALLSEGVRDGAAARAASDYLYTEKNGKVTACLSILSADLETGTLVITRNSPTPVYIAQNDNIDKITSESKPIGTSRNIRPTISEFSLRSGTTIVIFTDGLIFAGERYGLSMNIGTLLECLLEEMEPSAQHIADTILAEAMRLDQNRPNDDTSVVVLRVLPDETDQIRRMVVRLPVPPLQTPS
ncbi:MAG: serine/threonine-protein phosphatase [Anaerolineaceae bacterium]|nr:serine/threonine-protein phosphatase [Anaerolineaceae bacterium]